MFSPQFFPPDNPREIAMHIAVHRCVTLCAAVLVVFFVSADWPRFLGPEGNATSTDTGLPVSWSSSENIVWKTKLPGFGTSSPITLGERIYLTCYSGYGVDADEAGEMENLKRHVLCLDRDSGDIVWDVTAEVKQPEQEYRGYMGRHGYASNTPISDGERLYVFFGKSGVFAFDLDGGQLWQTDVGSQTNGWGSATSPVLFEDVVIINASVESGALVALDKKTGDEVWRASGMKSSWSTPALIDAPDGKTEVVVSIKGQLLGFDPATGEKLWNCDAVDDYVCPAVVAHDGIVYATGGRRPPTTVAVKAGGRGDVTESHVVWSVSIGSKIPTPIIHEGHMYVVSNDFTAYCLDLETGEQVYRERLRGRGEIYASPVLADGQIYAVSRESGTFVLAARPKFEQLAHNDLSPDTSTFNATPAISRGQLLIRSDRFLYCIGQK